ncbi:MAG: hypothetical protein EOO26_08110 [Comamonadaceae bacterium]|nr:MAG: hypothetical protein EOO26_08110 [Comamonadaceae bacterium]
MNLLPALLLCLHLLAAAFWVGGMATMHFAVRPAAVATLQPPMRLPLMAAALTRFFSGVTLSIVALWVSGLAMVWLAGGFARVHWSVHAMLTLALVMTAVYLRIRLAPWPKLKTALAASDWPVAARQLDRIRHMVAMNLVMGVAVFVVALVGRAF